MAELPFQQSVWSTGRATLLDTMAQRELKKQEEAKLARELAEEQRKAQLEQDKFALDQQKQGFEERKWTATRADEFFKKDQEARDQEQFNQRVEEYYKAMKAGRPEPELRALAMKIFTFNADSKDVSTQELGLTPLPTPVAPRPFAATAGSQVYLPKPGGGYDVRNVPQTASQQGRGRGSDDDVDDVTLRARGRFPPELRDSIISTINANPQLLNSQIKGLFRRDALARFSKNNPDLDVTEVLTFIDEVKPQTIEEKQPNFVTQMPEGAKWQMPVDPASMKGSVALPFGGRMNLQRPAASPSAAGGPPAPAAAPQPQPQRQEADPEVVAAVQADWEEIVAQYMEAGQPPPELTDEIIQAAYAAKFKEMRGGQ